MKFTDQIRKTLNKEKNPEERQAIREIAEQTRQNKEAIQHLIEKGVQRSPENKETEENLDRLTTIFMRDSMSLVERQQDMLEEQEQKLETAINYIEQEKARHDDELDEIRHKIAHLEEAILKQSNEQEKSDRKTLEIGEEELKELVETYKSSETEEEEEDEELGEPEIYKAKEWKQKKEEEQEEQESSTEPDFKCQICGKEFKDKRGAAGHLKSSHNKKGTGVVQKHNQLQENTENTENKITCTNCGYQTPNKVGLATHLRQSHDLKGEGIAEKYSEEHTVQTEYREEEPTQCPECSNQYPSLKGLSNHFRKAHYKFSEIYREDGEYNCPLCKEDFSISDGLSSHMTSEHDEGMLSYGVRNYEQLGGKDMPQVKEEETQVEETIEVDEEEDVLPPTYYSMEERKQLIIEEMKNSDKGLTAGELSREIYNIGYRPSSGSKYYSNTSNALQKLKRDGKVVKSDEDREDLSGHAQAYRLSMSKAEQESNGKDKLELVRDRAGVSNEDFNSMRNSLNQLINHQGSTEISYYDFEKVFKRHNPSINPKPAYQKLFQYSPLLRTIREEIAEGKEFKWNRKGNKGGGINDWTLKVKG